MRLRYWGKYKLITVISINLFTVAHGAQVSQPSSGFLELPRSAVSDGLRTFTPPPQRPDQQEKSEPIILAPKNNNQQNTNFVFPIPIEQIKLAPQRNSRPQNTSSPNKQILSIISEDEINHLLGNIPAVDNGPNHQAIRVDIAHILQPPTRPMDSLLTALIPPVNVGIPDPQQEQQEIPILGDVPNAALRGQSSQRVAILTPRPRPKDLHIAPQPEDNIDIDNSSTRYTFLTKGRLKIRYRRIRYQKIGICSVRNVREVSKVGQASIIPAAILQPKLSKEMAQFERNVLQPAARRYYGAPVTQIKQLSSYRCTNIIGTRTKSEHTKANALDVAAFVFANGRSVSLTKGWRGSRKERRFLREVKKGACQIFTTTLTPDYNRDHYNHFHFDNKRRKGKNICH